MPMSNVANAMGTVSADGIGLGGTSELASQNERPMSSAPIRTDKCRLTNGSTSLRRCLSSMPFV
jgi:hypothetical protein